MEKAPSDRSATASRRARLRRAGPVAALIAGAALLLSACGGSSGNTGSGGSDSPSGSPAAAATGPVAFAQCMRSNGVQNFPDPQGGHFLISGSVQSNPNFQTAEQKCQHLLGPNGATNGGGSGGANNAKLLAFAHCMQSHGVPQFPDPTAGGAIGLPQGVDPNSATFQKAWSKCQSKLPGSLQGQQP
jgi:hypothetical protein